MDYEKQVKICVKCNIDKPLCHFSLSTKGKFGVRSVCKVCTRILDKEYVKNNRTKVKESIKKYFNTPKGKSALKISIEKWRTNNQEKLKESNLKSGKKYRHNNKRKIKEIHKDWVQNKKLIDPYYKIICNMKTAVSTSLRENGFSKKSRTHEILGCSFEEFKAHLEYNFEPWMDWDNYGNPKDGVVERNKTWDVDHITPISSAKTEEEVLLLNHYTNLQPLCSYVNRFIKKDAVCYSP